MIFLFNHPTFSNQILIERNLWYEELIGHCQLWKLKIEDITRTDCCMKRILSLKEDFKAQKSQLQEEIEKEITVTIHYMVRFTKIVPKALDSIIQLENLLCLLIVM